MRRAAGFSLIEVMCAILILGTALVGLTRGLTTAALAGKDSEAETVAALLAAGQIETLRAEGYLVDGDKQGDGSGAFSAYRWKQSISASTVNGLHEVKVTIENSKSGKTIYELQTLLFDPPAETAEEKADLKSRDRKDSKSKRKGNRATR
ncbi:MAG TPA: type II secretion system protein [Verrucomicrobiae bacterium]|nr:type II secretion system protein [Verrucomicrobiae bacterium]